MEDRRIWITRNLYHIKQFQFSPGRNSVFIRRILKFSKSNHYLRHARMSVLLFIRQPGKTQLPLNRFSWNLKFQYFQKSAENIQVPLKSDKNNEYFTWKPTYSYDNISLNSS